MDLARRVRDVAAADQGLVDEVLAGLTATPKTLPPKLFYDEAGCALFGAITELPEYYLTRTETTILRRIAPDLASLLPARSALIEYGASDEAKGAILIAALAPRLYVPIDIASGALADLRARMERSHPNLAVEPIMADFMRPLVIPRAVGEPRVGFFPGSTIGNLDPEAALAFLRRARMDLGAGGALVIGVDLEKSPARLIPAYDDAAGVTARFNLNMLTRLNREAEADFVLAQFAHQVVWNAGQHRIEMHLRSEIAQTVMVAGQAITFAAGETIHTENSHKYAVPRFQALASRAGWRTAQVWSDDEALFAVYLLR
jgi:dimethylhistidine N-methyltransferase